MEMGGKLTRSVSMVCDIYIARTLTISFYTHPKTTRSTKRDELLLECHHRQLREAARCVGGEAMIPKPFLDATTRNCTIEHGLAASVPRCGRRNPVNEC